jgi:serine/threonine protein kinase
MILFNNKDTLKEDLLSYMIMPRYGQNLETFFEKQKCNISNSSILEIALGTLDMLESVHAAGYIYNDLKLDNIMVGFESKIAKEYKEENVLADTSLHLVDFGFATKFIDKSTGLHIKEAEVETFRGNMIFGSLNQLNFMTTSRRDDLISLCYMVIYMLNKG